MSSFTIIIKETKFCSCHLIYILKLGAFSLRSFMQTAFRVIVGGIIR